MALVPTDGFDRRGFLGVGGATLLCSLAGRTVEIRDPEDVRRAHLLAANTEKPACARAPEDRRRAARRAGTRENPGSARAPADGARFATPEPQPGGQKREYWLA